MRHAVRLSYFRGKLSGFCDRIGNQMRIGVFGAGYVGLVTAACLAEMGNDVVGVDVDPERVAALGAGRMPIYEPGLDALVLANMRAGRLRFTTEARAGIAGREVIFIAVGTPSRPDGSADLDGVRAVARTIGNGLDGYAVVVDKSTVPVGTCETVRRIIGETLAARGVQVPFDVVSNPEFLKEGAAIHDFQRADRIIIGADSERAVAVMRELYASFSRQRDKIIVMDPRSAELTKYAANAMLATRISFMNEMAALASALGADIEQVRLGIGSDPRIGPLFLYPGIGFGGSCFPKDLRALGHMGETHGVPLDLLDAVGRVNERQKVLLLRLLHRFFDGDLHGRVVAVWGLAFKPETDDVREAPALRLIVELLRAGARVQAYDPLARETALRALRESLPADLLEGLTLADTAEAATQGADVLALATEWNVFRSPDFAALARTLRRRAVFDGRNQWRPQTVRAHGLTYFGIGR